ncbi:MAG: DUF2516 family protein [Nocardioidaceae bacterium]|nr:DUF2516 family protein [Nocardioidaceae bacterium]
MFFEFRNDVVGIFAIALLLLNLWALLDAVLRPAQAFHAADKQTKKAWLWILGLALGVQVLLPGGLFMIIGIVAILVYLLDVRPALVQVTRRR